MNINQAREQAARAAQEDPRTRSSDVRQQESLGGGGGQSASLQIPVSRVLGGLDDACPDWRGHHPLFSLRMLICPETPSQTHPGDVLEQFCGHIDA